MPVIFSQPEFPWQYGNNPYNQAYQTELDYGQMLREVTRWNSALDAETAGRFVNNRYRQILDRRQWYATKLRGAMSIPATQFSGTATATNGSNIVQGNASSWTPALVGMQFRPNFSQPYQSIVAVDQTNQKLTLDTLYPGPTATGAYQIVQAYVGFGQNVKRLKWMVNQLFGWPVKVNIPVESLNRWDTWRTALGWTTVAATRPPTPDGQLTVELWPTPYQNQSFAFEAYTQPPNLVDDSDAVLGWIRADIVVSAAVADALLFKIKQNTFYDPATAVTIAGMKQKEFEAEIERLENIDESLDGQDVSWDYGDEEEGEPFPAVGSFYAQTHR